MNHALEDLRKSELFFSELEDALIHFSTPEELKGMVATLTVRSDEQGEPAITLMTKTRFPPLDDLKEHCDNLVYAAQRLDKLPVSYWRFIDPLYGNQRLFYIPMQVIEWGKQNDRTPQSFTREAMNSHILRSLPWIESPHPKIDEYVEERIIRTSVYRDIAEQSFRILDAYVVLREHFDRVGLPDRVNEF